MAAPEPPKEKTIYSGNEYRQHSSYLWAGHRILEAGGTSTDAVAVIKIMEDSPYLMQVAERTNHDGKVELDASIMNGDDLNAGATTGADGSNPLLALTFDNSPHVMLMGRGAEAFAKNQGLDSVEMTAFIQATQQLMRPKRSKTELLYPRVRR